MRYAAVLVKKIIDFLLYVIITYMYLKLTQK